LRLSDQREPNLFVDVTDIEGIPNITSREMATVLSVPMRYLAGCNGPVVGKDRFFNSTHAMNLNVKIDFTFSVFTKNLSMQISQINDFIIHQIIIKVMLIDLFLQEPPSVGM